MPEFVRVSRFVTALIGTIFPNAVPFAATADSPFVMTTPFVPRSTRFGAFGRPVTSTLPKSLATLVPLCAVRVTRAAVPVTASGSAVTRITTVVEPPPRRFTGDDGEISVDTQPLKSTVWVR